MADHSMTDAMTLLELANRSNGKSLMPIANVLSEENRILEDMPWIVSNKQTSHIITRAQYEPPGEWSQINRGVASEAGRTIQVEEYMGTLESYSNVDDRLIRLAENKRRARSDEDMLHVRGMYKNFVENIVYGAIADEARSFDGLTTRRDELGTNCYDNGGTGSDLTSIWVIQWGRQRVHGVYPKGSSGGIRMEDLGLRTKEVSGEGEYQVWKTHFEVSGGIAVHDERCLKRLANIESSGSTDIFDHDMLIQLLVDLPESGQGAVIYVNKTVMAQMISNAVNKTNVQYTMDQPYGNKPPLIRFMGYPVKLVEQIVDTEDAVS